MKEVICVNIGQSGVQLSNAAWELFCSEHGIKANGQLKESLSEYDSTAFTTFFQEVPTGQYVPRVVSIDMEPTVIDEVRTGAYRNLFHPDQLISGYEDAANNFARGHFTIGKSMIDYSMSVIRKAVECCEYLQNFFILNSFGGGSGSGFTSLLLDKLAIEYTNRFRVQLSVCISPVLTTSVVEPYNAVLTMHSSMNHTDIAILTDNEAVYCVCLESLDISRPTYANINRIIAQNFSDMTASIRFESSLSSDMDQLITNLVPYPRIHFPVMSHAPNISENRAGHQQLSTAEITRAVFNRNCILVTCDPSNGKYMSCCLQYRGDVTPKDVNACIYDIKRKSEIKFVDWCPTGFKLGINSQPPVAVPASEMAQTSRSVSMLSNTSSINQTWLNVNDKFHLLFAKRAFVHWFVGEGMEEGELNEARDDLLTLIADYNEISEDVYSGSTVEEPRGASVRQPGRASKLSFKNDGVLESKLSKSNTESSTGKQSKPVILSTKSDSSDEEEDEEEDDEEDDDEDSYKMGNGFVTKGGSRSRQTTSTSTD